MVFELRQTPPIDADYNPPTNIAEKLEERKQWPYRLSNDLRSDSHPNNGVPSSTQLPKVSKNHHVCEELQNVNQQPMWAVNRNPVESHHRVISSTSSGFHNSDSSMKMGYNVYNSAFIKIPDPQYVGGSSIRHSASTNIFSNGIYNTVAFGDKKIPRNMSFPISVNDMQSFYPVLGSLQPNPQNTQGSASGTFLHPRFLIPAPHQPNLRAHQLADQSNGFKIQRLNTWTPVQARPRLSEESRSHDCNGLNCNIYRSAPFSVESRKREQPFNPPSNESWYDSGSLMDMIPVQSNGIKIQRVDSWKPAPGRPCVAEETSSHNCFGLNCNLCGPATFGMETRKRKYPFDPPRNESSIDNGTLMDVLKGFLNSSAASRVSQELLASLCLQPLHSQHPPLEQLSDNSEGDVSVVKKKPSTVDSGLEVNNITADNAIGNNLIAKGSLQISDSTDTELKEAPKLSFEELTSDGKGESSHVRTEVICGTFMDLLTSSNMNTSVEDPVITERPNLEQLTNSSEDVSVINTVPLDSGPKGNRIVAQEAMQKIQMLKGSEGNNDTASEELKEPPKLSFEEKASDEKVESSRVIAKVICGFNTAPDDYEPALESMQCMTPKSVLESDKTKTQATFFDDNKSGSENIKLPSASLAASFSASQIKEYLSSFIQPNKEITPSVSQNICQLCSMDKLSLSPAPMYCSCCELRIMQKAVYCRLKDEDTNTEHNVCKKCYHGSCGCIKLIHGGSVSKTNKKEKKNDEEREDSWVQCDRCQLWQHRICGLYNDETDAEGKAEYVCPKCCLKELENGTGILLPKTVLGAKDLPRTNLSDHIEQRLFRRLKQEREDTANFHGIEPEKVLEAEGLVVRVVVSDDKELEVRQQFRDIFHGKDYPEKMPYRSKLILLFQRTGGVDLCLFGMYVQEFGSECDGPSKRCIYISYLDSVKYFQPERKTTTSESLRTLVYHEILIGYLEYCKKRGFGTCYIYSCPLKKGDDYIFYGHPIAQKTPEKKKLLQWYKSMLSKATKDGIVVGVTNFYNQFFVPTKEGNIKITAARLPYFESDTWSETAIKICKELDEEEEKEKEKSGKKSTKLPIKRNLMSMEQDNPTKDALVMQRLSEKIHSEKEHLMIVRLHHMCTYCHELILSGSRWSCNQCNKIHLCSRCYDDGKLLPQNKMHSCHSGTYCQLSEYVLSEVPLDTNDKDDVLVNNFFETRDDFLNKCQKSLYHFEKLGHAKYSSMMILYHLTRDLSVQPKGDTCCPTHKLNHPLKEVTSEPKNEEPAQKQNIFTLNGALDTLVHSSGCKSKDCSYPECQIVKKLYLHTSGCKIRAKNGCVACQQAWWIIKKHFTICTDSNCRIPRCRETRKHRETLASSSKKTQNPTK